MKQTEVLAHASHVNSWFPAVYMNKNFCLVHASNLSARNFSMFSANESGNECLSVDDLKGISADFAAICRRVSEHPILVLSSVFPIDG